MTCASFFRGSLTKCSRSSVPRKLLTPTSFQQQLVANRFWEPDRKSGYDTEVQRKVKVHIQDGLKELKPEVIKWKDEWIRVMKMDNVNQAFIGEHNDYEIVWKFDNKETIDTWTVSTDKDHGEGKSSGEFIMGPNKTGIFRGSTQTDVPKDGTLQRAGYVNIRSPTNMISFKRVRPLDWARYTHLLVRTRGDGRPYNVVIGMDRYYDINWNDQYHYPLYTRGGPYWQISKIPFNKFYLAGKGRVQDRQERIQLENVAYVGVTIADGYTGPFQLEIDWMGCIYDEAHNNRFVYEMYEQGYLMS